jgi:hypothetical protein
MNYRTAAFIAIVIALVGLAAYWYTTRPTAEETALKAFFTQFRNGKYTEAEKLTARNDFYRMAADTSITDTDGSKYVIGKYFPETYSGLLRIAIETYVKAHITEWRYMGMETQHLSDTESAVKFRVDLAVRDFTTGNLLGASHTGSIEGVAYMVDESEGWKVQKFEMTLVSNDGMVLSKYLTQVGNEFAQ